MIVPRSILGLIVCLFVSGEVARCEPLKLKGHAKSITAVVFSPDGKTVASAGLDGKVYIWDLNSGKPLHILDADPKGVYALTISPNGKRLASGGMDRAIRLWDPTSGKEVRRLEGHEDRVAALAFSPDGKLLASGGYDGMIRLWDVGEGKTVRKLMGQKGHVTSLAFTADGKTLASGGVAEARFELNTNLTITGSADNVRLWAVENGKEQKKLETRGSTVVFSGDGTLLLAGGGMPEVRRTRRSVTLDGVEKIGIVEVSSGKEKTTIKGRGKTVASHGKLFATGAGSYIGFDGFGIMGPSAVNSRESDDRVHIWETATAKDVLRLPEEYATTLAFSADGERLVTGNISGEVVVWNLSEEKKTPTPDPAEIIPHPPASDKLLSQLDADFEALLKKEKNPVPVLKAAKLFHRTNRSSHHWDYREALALLRRHRSPAGVPLILRYMVEHESFGRLDSSSYVDTLAMLTGEDIADPYRSEAARVTPVRNAVQGLVDRWWQPNKDRITIDLAKMSRAQLQVVVPRLLQQIEWNSRHRDYGPIAQRLESRLSSVMVPDEGRRRDSWYPSDVHPAMVPILLAGTGYEDPPPAARDERPRGEIAFAAIPLLAYLRENREAPALDKIVADARQDPAARITCLLALQSAGEDAATTTLLEMLEKEKRLEHRILCILALAYSKDRKKVVPKLMALLDDSNVHIRGAAVLSLREAKPVDALPKLEQVLEDPRPEALTVEALYLIAAIGTPEGHKILVKQLRSALDGPERRRVPLLHFLLAFERSTGKKFTEAGAHPDNYYRTAARKALEWWDSQK